MLKIKTANLPPDQRQMVHPDFLANEQAYLDMRGNLLPQYSGQWAAVRGGKVIAAGMGLLELVEAASVGGAHPYIAFVGDEDAVVFEYAELSFRSVAGVGIVSVFEDDAVRNLLLRAWQESVPGTLSAHEEGGFVLRDANGSLSVERWPGGTQNEIFIPAHPGGKRGDLAIVATFHTHPNPGPDYQQEPGLTDIRAVRNDVDLRHPDYEGEYVIASEWIYRIQINGDVEKLGKTNVVFRIS